MMLAALGALAIGLSLGLLGSGGSILTVPVLIYLLGQDEKTAIAGSLFIVGAIALAGGGQFALARQVHWRSVLLFGLPGMLGTALGAQIGGRVSGAVQLAVFAAVMLLAAALMFKGRTVPPEAHRTSAPRGAFKVAIDGLLVGVLTGFVGVGGGFLIVPALVLLGGLPMHLAVGTSLMIIATKSFTGFLSYLEVLSRLDLALDWTILLLVTALGVAGRVAGRMLGSRIPQQRLRRVFSIFLIAIGIFIFISTLPQLL